MRLEESPFESITVKKTKEVASYNLEPEKVLPRICAVPCTSDLGEGVKTVATKFASDVKVPRIV